MIEKTLSYKVGDKFCATLEEAQAHELWMLLESIDATGTCRNTDLATELVKHADKVIDILSTNAKSRPKARSINGATRKPRKAKPAGHFNSVTGQPEVEKA